jgi:flagellar biosynthesis/type III secretory pathway protein FliH
MLSMLKANLLVNPNKDPEDQELAMRLSPIYDQQLEQARQEARQEAQQQGLQQGQRGLIENLLASRFGSLDEELAAMISRLIALPPEEFAPLLLQLSREELLSRFGE